MEEGHGEITTKFHLTEYENGVEVNVSGKPTDITYMLHKAIMKDENIKSMVKTALEFSEIKLEDDD